MRSSSADLRWLCEDWISSALVLPMVRVTDPQGGREMSSSTATLKLQQYAELPTTDLVIKAHTKKIGPTCLRLGWHSGRMALCYITHSTLVVNAEIF